MLIKIKLLIFFVIIFIALHSCDNKDTTKILVNENITKFDNYAKVREISLTKLTNYKSGAAKSMLLVDSTLFIFNISKGIKYFISVYSVKNNTFYPEQLPYGRGPGESLGGFDFGINNNKLWVYDITLQRIMDVDLSLLLSGGTVEFKEFKKIPNSQFRLDIELLDSNTFIGLTSPYDVEKRNTKIDIVDLESRKILETYGEYYNFSKIPIEAVKRGFRQFLFIKPSKDKAALAYLETDILEIFDLHTTESKALWGPYKIQNEFNIFNRKGRYITEETKNTISTFVGGTVSNNFIYLVYSGVKTWKNPFPTGNTIFIYDWEGKPVEKLTVDSKYAINCIAVSKDDKMMYLFDQNTGNILCAEIL